MLCCFHRAKHYCSVHSAGDVPLGNAAQRAAQRQPVHLPDQHKPLVARVCQGRLDQPPLSLRLHWQGKVGIWGI